MIDPILRVRRAVEGRVLDIDVRVRRVEIRIGDGCRLARDVAGDGDAGEIGWNDQVDVLARVGEEAHHGEGDEGAEGAAVVVSWQAAVAVGEVGWDVEVGAVGGAAGAAGVVVLEDGEEGGLVADVFNVGFVQVVEAGDEGCGATHVGY